MEIAIETTELNKEYPARVALNQVTFEVKKGAIHGFLGPNGAGKTTTMKILAGLLMPSSGSYKINGRVGFLPENPPLYANMTVDDYLRFVLTINSENLNEKRILEVKEQCGLTEVSDRLIGNLSKGYKQRVGIAQALIHSPEIIILDEPTVGLDPVAIVEIRKLIESLRGKHTVLFSSHQLHEVELLCQEITLINHGQILVSGTLSEIQKNLTTKKQFKAIVKNFNEEIANELKSKVHIDSIEMHKVPEDSLMEISIFANVKFNDAEDVPKLTAFLGSSNIGLFRFNEEKLDLEEIFKRMTLGDTHA